jgi:hypothetical protein
MTNFDHIAAAREVIALLRECGRESDAKNLERSIEEGATGTEILMALRYYVSGFISGLPVGSQVLSISNQLLTELNKSI